MNTVPSSFAGVLDVNEDVSEMSVVPELGQGPKDSDLPLGKGGVREKVIGKILI